MFSFVKISTAALVISLAFLTPVSAQEEGIDISAADVLRMIEENGAFAFQAASADLDIAKAREDEARAALFPRLDLSATARHFESTAWYKYPKDGEEVWGGLSVTQPVYDFGKTGSKIDAGKYDVEAAKQKMKAAKNVVLLEGMALFYELHASELLVHSQNENFANAYVKWERAKENMDLGREDGVIVAEKLALLEKSRVVYYRELSNNQNLRTRLTELTGMELPGELINPPKPPKEKPFDVDRDLFVDAIVKTNPELQALVNQAKAKGMLRSGIGSRPVVEAFGEIGESSRDLRSRNRYAVGARMSWPLFDGGINSAQRARLAGEEGRLNAKIDVLRRELRRKAYKALMDRDNAYRQVIMAQAMLDYANKNLLRRQQLYSQDREADLGRAMIVHAEGEAELVRATGAYDVDRARIAVMLGEHPLRGLEKGFLSEVTGQSEALPDEQYTPKGGSGFGQEDQNELNRKKRP